MTLSEEDHQKLFTWLLHKAETLKLTNLDPTVFANYVRSLVIRKISHDKLHHSLIEFLGKSNAKHFCRELNQRLKTKDFDIHLETEDLNIKLDLEQEGNINKEESSDFSEVDSSSDEDDFTKDDEGKIAIEKEQDNEEITSLPDTQFLQQVSYDEPELMPKIPKERFIIFIAGLAKEHFSIYKVYKIFHNFGRIIAIQYDDETEVFFIEYLKLSYAFRAINKGPKLIGNSNVKIDYAFTPNKEAIEAIEKQIEQHKEDYTVALEDDELQKLIPKIVVSAIDAKKFYEEEMKEMVERMKRTYSALANDQKNEKHILEIQISRLLRELGQEVPQKEK